MPRLSMYQPTKTNDYKFMDRTIREQFWVGGVAAIIHKYVGPAAQPDMNDPTQPNYMDGREVDPLSGEFINVDGILNETKIQDLLFMENRDRKYDTDIYELRGVYNVSDNDFDLSQFGLFLSNDTFYMTFHINDMVEILGRKLLSGDVIELPHLRDELLLDTGRQAVNKYFVVNDASKGAEGFSKTWYAHIWRVKLSPINDAQEYRDILGSEHDANSLKNAVSTYKSEFNISDAIVASAAQDDPIGKSLVDHLFGYDYPTSGGIVNRDDSYNHGEVIASGGEFPNNPKEGDFFIRSDFSPARMFVRRGSKWNRRYDNITDKTWTDRTYNASGFINNEQHTTVVDNQEFKEKQALSDVILPKSDALAPITPEPYMAAGYVDPGYVE